MVMNIYNAMQIMFRFCSFRLRDENKVSTYDSRQSNSSRNFNVMTEGLRLSSLELNNGQKLNTVNCRG